MSAVPLALLLFAPPGLDVPVLTLELVTPPAADLPDLAPWFPPVVRPDQPVLVRATLRYDGDREWPLSGSYAPDVFNPRVIGPRDEPAPRTRFGQDVLFRHSFSGPWLDPVRRGEPVTVGPFHMNRLFDMTADGDYTITCTVRPIGRLVPLGEGTVERQGPEVRGFLRVRVAGGSAMLNAEEALRQYEYEAEKDRRRMEARLRELEAKRPAGWWSPPFEGGTLGVPEDRPPE